MELINITADDLKQAANKASVLIEPHIRERVYFNTIGLNVFFRWCKKNKIEYQEGKSHDAEILEFIDINHVIINNYRIDIRVMTGDTFDALYIPKIPFDIGFKPDFYVAVRLNHELDKAEIKGYLKTESVLTKNYNEDYYIAVADRLAPISELNKFLKQNEPKKTEEQVLAKGFDCEQTQLKIFDFIDKTLSQKDHAQFIYHVIQCPECRTDVLNCLRVKSKAGTKDIDKLLSCKSTEELINDPYIIKLAKQAEQNEVLFAPAEYRSKKAWKPDTEPERDKKPWVIPFKIKALVPLAASDSDSNKTFDIELPIKYPLYNETTIEIGIDEVKNHLIIFIDSLEENIVFEFVDNKNKTLMKSSPTDTKGYTHISGISKKTFLDFVSRHGIKLKIIK